MDALDLGWRDGILLAVVGAAIYLVITLLRLTQLGRRRPPAVTPPPTPAPTLAATKAPASHVQATPPPTPLPAAASAATMTPSAFAEHLQWAALDAEVDRLRQDVQALTAEVQDLRRELTMLSAARHVSPHYAEAMSLAQRGLSAQEVADRCGISLGEAELVIALARGPRDFAEEDDYGEPNYRGG